MTEKFKDISNYQNNRYQKAAQKLSEYFDKIGEKESEKYFPRTFSIKERIYYNVIYDEKTRKTFSELEKLYDQDDLNKLSKNQEIQNVVKKIINDESICKSFSELEKEFDISKISSLSNNLIIYKSKI